jgi:metallo-beta-lactamase family protein
MELTCLGAARTVTGSMHLVRTRQATVLLDCGLFQGRRRESFQRNRDLPVDPGALDAVVLSHAHIDHSGALPVLQKRGYRGPIYATPATRDLCAEMLMDAAHIQVSDARHVNRLIQRDGVPMDPVEPLYEPDDVTRTLAAFVGVPYHRPQTIAPGVRLTLLDAGHVLGSAIVVLDVEEDGETRRLVFTGDLGRRDMPILRDPEVPDGTYALLMESTYGDRRHPPLQEMQDSLARVVNEACGRGGKILIPSFALERTQDLLYALSALLRDGRIPPVPVYVDSPLAVRLTDVFRMYPECYDAPTRARILGGDSPFDFPTLRYVSAKEDSIAIGQAAGPAVIVAASGMCEGGRVLHHLQGLIESERNTVLIIGFQAQHTLGRRLVEQRPKVRIFGVERERFARVVVLNGFSAHADRDGLLAFAEETRRRGPLRQVLLVHGEPQAQDALRDALTASGFPSVRIPEPGEQLVV